MEISVSQLLDAVGAFDEFGGASLALVAWELCADDEDVLRAWRTAQRERLLKPGDRDPDINEQLWRLTGKGWTARRAVREQLERVPAADN
jgi:hypothetical protein